MTKYICQACGHDYSEGKPHEGTLAPLKSAYWISLLAEAAGKRWAFPCPKTEKISVVLAVEEGPPPLPTFHHQPRVADGKWRF